MRCPNCQHDNISGVDICESCGSDLGALDVPQPTSGLQHSILTTLLSEIPKSDPNTLQRDATVADAIALMRSARHGVTLIVDDDNTLVGIFTEADLVHRVGIDSEPETISIIDVMTPAPYSLGPADSMAHALNAMAVGNHRHIAIAAGRKPIGQLSVRNVLAYLRETVL